MRTKMIVAVLAALLLAVPLSSCTSGGKTELKWVKFDQGLAEAQKTGKKVLIDVYTDWCGWCKRMDADTYSNTALASYLSSKYVLVKLNAESGNQVTYKGQKMTEQELAGAFGITGYPTTVFLKSSGEPITGYPGYADVRKFSDVASFIAEDHYLTQKFDAYVQSRNK